MAERTMIREYTILLVSDDTALCAAARRELEATEDHPRVASVSTLDAARRILEDAAPAVILLEERMLATEPRSLRRKQTRLDSAVACLAGYAPVVVLGAAGHKNDVASLVAAGAADYVESSSECLPAAIKLLEARLRQAIGGAVKSFEEAGMVFEGDGEEFGELLRHELNNPLTGILGNAELLLADVRRKNDGRLPCNAQRRLETIAALAVRMRETVRRLSQQLEAR